MKRYLSCDLVERNNTSYLENFNKLNNEDENDGQNEYNQNLRNNKKTEKAVKVGRCFSNPQNCCVHYKERQPKNNSNKSREHDHEQRETISDDALKNEPNTTCSTEKIKELLLKHADSLNLVYEKYEDANGEQPQNDETTALPAELWWVPPLKLPTSRSVPSVAMSKCCSAASSVGPHSKTRRSAEVLRQRVDSVCDLIEAMGIIEVEKQQSSNHNSHSSSTRSMNISIPLLKIPSISNRTSCRGEEDEDFKRHTSYKTVGSQCTVVEPPQLSTDCREGSATLRMHTGAQPVYSSPTQHENNAVRVASSQNDSSRYDNNSHSNLSVSDLACIHIVNPMLSKLARLCTAQGQQYLNVLEELEKACNDFHKACKFQGVSK